MKKECRQDKESFMKAYNDYADDIFRYCLLRLGNKEKVTDMVQDVFMKSWNYMRQGAEIDNMRAFLYTTARHLIIDEYRKRKPDRSLDEMEEETDFEPSFNETDRLLDRLDGEQALRLLGDLPEMYSEVIFMRY